MKKQVDASSYTTSRGTTLIEMYLAGVSVRRIEDITEALWGTRVSPGTVSNLNKKIYAKIDEWRHRKIEGEQVEIQNRLE